MNLTDFIQNIEPNRAKLEKTNTYVNNFILDQPISNEVDEAIIGYFEQITENKKSARLVAGALIRTSISQGLDPMVILENFTKLKRGQVNAYLNMFLNFNRVGTSYLGLLNPPEINKYVARAIKP